MTSILFGVAKSILFIGFVMNMQTGLSQTPAFDMLSKTKKSFRKTQIGFGTETFLNGDTYHTYTNQARRFYKFYFDTELIPANEAMDQETLEFSIVNLTKTRNSFIIMGNSTMKSVV